MEQAVQFFVENGSYGLMIAALIAAGLGLPLPEDIVMISGAILAQRGLTDLWLTVAALAFGLFVVGLDASSDASVPWTVLVARSLGTSFALGALAVVSAPLRPPTQLLPIIVAVGFFDTFANVLVAFATTRGPAGIVAVLSALYPVTTIVLARALLGERLDRTRRVGGALALGGAAAVALG